MARKAPKKRESTSQVSQPEYKRKKVGQSAAFTSKGSSEDDSLRRADAADALLLLHSVCNEEGSRVCDDPGARINHDGSGDGNVSCSDHIALCGHTSAEVSIVPASPCKSCQGKDDEICRLKLKMLEMEKKLDKAEIEYFGLERLSTDDAQMAYYTGLPSYSEFKCLLSFLEPQLSAVHRHSDAAKGRERRLAPADELVMVLLRLRTGMHIKDLAYRFGFKSVSHVSVLLQRWISFLSKVLDCLIIWPSRQQIKRNMPSAFQMSSEYKKIRCILDCTEFAIQAPSALSLNAMNYSEYKSHTL